MAEYTYKDVIIDPEDPRVEIGKEYIFGTNPTSLLWGVRSGRWEREARPLVKVNCDAPSVDPFYNGMASYPCLIRKKEPVKKYVPFDLSKEEDRAWLRGAWVRHKNSGREHVITGLYLDETPPRVEINDYIYELEYLFEEYEFVDGSPCGQLVEEE